jgi:hypothetical protein
MYLEVALRNGMEQAFYFFETFTSNLFVFFGMIPPGIHQVSWEK